jgi:hypothetical protein
MDATKNLSYYRELDNNELTATYGGIFWFILGGIIVAVTKEVISDWDNFKAGLTGQPEIRSW